MAIVRLLSFVSVLVVAGPAAAQPAAKAAPSAKTAQAAKPQGTQLIAHELTHVVQQAAAHPMPKMKAAEKKSLSQVAAKIRAGDSKGASHAWKRFIIIWAKTHGPAELEAIEHNLIADAMGPKAQRLRRTAIAVRQLEEHLRSLRAKRTQAKSAPVSVRSLSWNEKTAALKRGKSTKLTRSQLEQQIEKAASLAEEVRNQRQMMSTAFQNFDQKTNQQYNLLSAIMKAVHDTRMSTIRNML